MTSRERVRRAVLFEGPDKVPCALPEPYRNDFTGGGVLPKPELKWENNANYVQKQTDEFGCVWEKLAGDKTMGQVVEFPLDDYSKLDDFKFPNYKEPDRYEHLKKVIAENKEEKFVLVSIPFSLIHRLEYLRGHEAAWTDPYEYPNELEKLLDILSDIAIDAIDMLAEIGGIDGIISYDDWGLQDRPIVSPDIFVKFWKPRYKRVYHHAHEKGMLTFLHSCGHITDLLPHLIDAELDVIQQDQQENMGVDILAEKFGGKICFWDPVDIQSVMVHGTVEDVRAYARKLIDSFGRFNGGFIAKWYSDPDAVEHSWEKIHAMCKEFMEYGEQVYQK